MLFLEGVYVEHPDGSLRFRWVKAPTSSELARLTQTLAQRISRYLERQRLLERDAENSYLAGDALEAGPMEQLLGSSITYRIAAGPQRGRKVFPQQTLPACDEPFDDGVGKVAGSSLHAGVRRGRMNARSLSGCVGISAGRPSRKSACRSRRTATSLTTCEDSPMSRAKGSAAASALETKAPLSISTSVARAHCSASARVSKIVVCSG